MGKKQQVTLQGFTDMVKAQALTQFYTGDENTNKTKVVYCEGPMGEGKSSSIRNLILELQEITGVKWGYKDMRLSFLDSSDLQGLPNFTKEIDGQTFVTWVKDKGIPTSNTVCKSNENCLDINSLHYISDALPHPKYGILVLDELNQVERDDMKSLLYNLLLDRRINDLEIAHGWIIVAMSNRREDGGVYNRLPAPARDRLLIVDLQSNPKATIEYFVKKNFNPHLINYLKANSERISTYNPNKEDSDINNENYVFSTPRSWEFVNDCLEAYDNLNRISNGDPRLMKSPMTLRNEISACIGEEDGKAFFTYLMQVASNTYSINASTTIDESTLRSNVFEAWKLFHSSIDTNILTNLISQDNRVLKIINSSNELVEYSIQYIKSILGSPQYSKEQKVVYCSEIASIVFALTKTDNTTFRGLELGSDYPEISWLNIEMSSKCIDLKTKYPMKDNG